MDTHIATDVGVSAALAVVACRTKRALQHNGTTRSDGSSPARMYLQKLVVMRSCGIVDPVARNCTATVVLHCARAAAVFGGCLTCSLQRKGEKADPRGVAHRGGAGGAARRRRRQRVEAAGGAELVVPVAGGALATLSAAPKHGSAEFKKQQAT
jgi:hypothetical protein